MSSLNATSHEASTDTVMQDSIHGRVLVNDTPEKRNLHRFCRKKIEQWLQRNNHADLGADFEVSFADDESGSQVSCVTEIKLGGSRWRGCDLDQDRQRAFMHSMKRLQPH